MPVPRAESVAYGENTPGVLRALHGRQISNTSDAQPGSSEKEVERITRVLLTDAGIDLAWQAFSKIKGGNSKSDADWLRCWETSLLSAVLTASLPPSDDWDLLSPRNRRSRAKKIARLSRELAEELHGRFGIHFFKLLDLPGVLNESRIAALEKAGMSSPESFGAAAWLFLDFRAADVLMALAADVEQQSDEPPLVPKPKRKDARRTAFIRRLSAAVRSQFKQPLHEHVASIVAAVLNDPGVTADMVRKISGRTTKSTGRNKAANRPIRPARMRKPAG